MCMKYMHKAKEGDEDLFDNDVFMTNFKHVMKHLISIYCKFIFVSATLVTLIV